MTLKCSACSRTVSIDRYCIYHGQAFEKLKEHYNLWVKAYGSISFCEYLKRLVKMDDTGKWIKEVIVVELKKSGVC
jgi:hypothetical protein